MYVNNLAFHVGDTKPNKHFFAYHYEKIVVKYKYRIFYVVVADFTFSEKMTERV